MALRRRDGLMQQDLVKWLLNSKGIRTENGCLVYPEAYTYASVHYKGSSVRVHRLVYADKLGILIEELSSNVDVLHKCDNPPCFEPAHLFEGTDADNTADAFSKGRREVRQGTKHGMARLNDATVISIRHRVANGESRQALSLELDIDYSHICKIVRGDSWRHLKLP